MLHETAWDLADGACADPFEALTLCVLSDELHTLLMSELLLLMKKLAVGPRKWR